MHFLITMGEPEIILNMDARSAQRGRIIAKKQGNLKYSPTS